MEQPQPTYYVYRTVIRFTATDAWEADRMADDVWQMFARSGDISIEIEPNPCEIWGEDGELIFTDRPKEPA